MSAAFAGPAAERAWVSGNEAIRILGDRWHRERLYRAAGLRLVEMKVEPSTGRAKFKLSDVLKLADRIAADPTTAA